MSDVLASVDDATREMLRSYGFDQIRFERLAHAVTSGALSSRSNAVSGSVGPPAADDLSVLPEPGSAEWTHAHAAGVEALRAGRVAAVVLAGGMATRFGGVVKGAVAAVDGGSFLAWKLGETARLATAVGTDVPVALMTSFATDAATRAHVAELDVPVPLWFSQFVSLRLERDGTPFLDAEGHVSPYGPGHGDLVDALRTSGTVDLLRARGVRIVTVSNVDNLGARVDPVVVGAHLLGGRPLTLEVARKEGDMGGAPARVDGRLRMLETARFPDSFDHDRIAVFNTNTAVVDLDVFAASHELDWLYVEKDVDGRVAVQLERLYHELSWTVPTQYLVVPRSGARGRFFPIKTPADLTLAQPALREMLATQVV